VISARTDTVHRAVALIGPDEHRRAECVNAVHVALTEIAGTDADLRRAFHSRTKRAKRAAKRLHKAAARLQDVLADPDLPEYLGSFFPPAAPSTIRKTIDGRVCTLMLPIPSGNDESLEWGRGETARLLTLWVKRANVAGRDKSEKSFQPKALKKLLAAEQAHKLLRQFNPDNISTTEGSAFCRLAALLHGTPKAKFRSPCWRVLQDVRRVAEMPKLRPVKK
jgi:hypothetical protein